MPWQSPARVSSTEPSSSQPAWRCGGCRARAYAMTGDYLAGEPFCNYRPGSVNKQD